MSYREDGQADRYTDIFESSHHSSQRILGLRSRLYETFFDMLQTYSDASIRSLILCTDLIKEKHDPSLLNKFSKLFLISHIYYRCEFILTVIIPSLD